jgi:sulfur carrier protein ThiS
MVKIILDSKEIKIDKIPSNCIQLLEKLGISRQEALIKIDGRFRCNDSKLEGAREIEIIRVVFGG